MNRDLFSEKPAQWRKQDELAAKIARVHRRADKDQIVTLLCAALMRMTRKPHRRY